MSLSREKLKIYLNDRKRNIELKKYSGIGEIISSLSMLFTLICSDFKNTIFTYYIIVKVILYIISIAILLYGIYILIYSLKNPYSIEKCFTEICELEDEKSYVQNIILLQNNNQEGRYLLVYNPSWKCYLFPSYSGISKPFSSVNEEKHFVPKFANCLGIDEKLIDVQYIGEKKSRKINVAEKRYMNYDFRFYTVKNLDLPYMKKRFKSNGMKFVWATIDSMYKSRNIIKKNKDVLDFVCDHTTISK